MTINLDNFQEITGTDKSNLKQLLLDFPEQCLTARKIGEKEIFPSAYKASKNIIFSGLGGSAVSGDLIRSYLAGEAKVPIVINRNYGLPEFVDSSSLVFICSYSGNTEETIQSFEDGLSKKAKLIVVTSGGKLKTLADEAGIPFVTIPQGLPPRAALGYSFFPALIALSKLSIINEKNSQIEEVVTILSQLKEKLRPEVKTEMNQAKLLAGNMYGKFPLVYASNDFFDVVSYRWRTQLAENSKSLSSNHVFPELTHNEIVGWEFPQKLLRDFVVICLRDKHDHPRISKRMDITASIVKEKANKIIEVWSEGKGVLARIFSLIYVGDFVSFYLAILNNVDPTPVDRITYLKKKLAETG
ncbi:MAG: bifunctional phosphoglucose/phosphomannose isomerase [Candidatus Omnitrophota bacterium]|nr:bifunctional phosphoglucose/phosphomannose isomerase [Candidatus Omnitrophota bacterium]